MMVFWAMLNNPAHKPKQAARIGNRSYCIDGLFVRILQACSRYKVKDRLRVARSRHSLADQSLITNCLEMYIHPQAGAFPIWNSRTIILFFYKRGRVCGQDHRNQGIVSPYYANIWTRIIFSWFLSCYHYKVMLRIIITSSYCNMF